MSESQEQRTPEEIQADIESLDREQRDIRAELRGGGQDGLGERLAEIEGLIDTRQKKLAALELEAEAARMLHEALNEAQRDLRFVLSHPGVSVAIPGAKRATQVETNVAASMRPLLSESDSRLIDEVAPPEVLAATE